MDERIGLLMRSGKPVYYAYPNGFALPPVEGSLVQVEVALGLRTAEPKKKTASSISRLREYIVTVTPVITVYSGNNTCGEYTVSVWAHSSREASRKAREERRENEGRHAVKAKFRAELK